MSVYARTLGKSILSPAICDRCRLRGAAADMIPDPDKNGLFVHKKCADNVDPWKLPPRQTEEITIPRPRPDASVRTFDTGLVTSDHDNSVLLDNNGNVLTQ